MTTAALLMTVMCLAGATGVPQAPSKAAQVVAEGKGVTITQEQLEGAAAGDLLNLALQRQWLLETQLEQLVSARVIALEAAARQLSETDLLQQDVYGKLTEPTNDEVTAYYEASRDLMKETQDRAVPRIRQALIAQQRQKAYRAYVDRLKTKYGVRVALPPVRVPIDTAGRPARGPADAPVTLIEVSDFECPFCQAATATVSRLANDFAGRLRVVFVHFPLVQIHPNAMKAAEAANCAGTQGKFWEMHDELFKPGEKLTPAELVRRAGQAGVDVKAFEACLADGGQADRVKADMEMIRTRGVASTPSFFINGRPVMGAQPYEQFAKIFGDELAAGQKPARPPERRP